METNETNSDVLGPQKNFPAFSDETETHAPLNVTKTYFPPLDEYTAFLNQIWESGWATNHGKLALRLEDSLKRYLQVPHLRFLANGTIALQIAIKALELDAEVITTPFSYVATTSSLVWEGCQPVFVDIEPDTLTIDPNRVESAITSKTKAIVATHVYGNPCDVEALHYLAKKHGLKIIYDAAHAFGVRYRGTSLLNFGDISTISFHATKLFHTVEGGAVVTQEASLDHKMWYLSNFGHNGPEAFHGVGINGKNSEFHAAMGLCVLPRVNGFIEHRKEICDRYDSFLLNAEVGISRPLIRKDTQYNFAYYPIVCPADSLLRVQQALLSEGIRARRYFYPALNQLNYVVSQQTPVATDISERVLCLPLAFDTSHEQVLRVCEVILSVLRKSS